MSFCPIIQSNCRGSNCEFYSRKNRSCLIVQACQIFVDKHIVDDDVREVLNTLSKASTTLIEPADVEYIDDCEVDDDELWLYEDEEMFPNAQFILNALDEI